MAAPSLPPLAMPLPEPLLARFRAAAFERLERIDTTWTALTQGSAPSRADEEMFRELHTLKGDARVVGFADVAVLCQRLEDLLSAARGRRYNVHEDVDVVVTMAIQFAGMLLRKKAGTTRGIDLEGFLAQIEVVLAEWLRRTSSPPSLSSAPSSHGKHMRPDAGSKSSVAACERLSIAATAVYLEYLRASGGSRERMRGIWESLRREIADLESIPLGPLVAGHVAAARELARDLGKVVEVSTEGVELRVNPDVLDAINTAVLHAVRNAVDHGIDSPQARAEADKNPTASLRVIVRQRDDVIEVDVSDDGGGVDFEAVKRRAAALGIPTGGAAGEEWQLGDLLFAPGFSTRDEVTEISGRGVGLDAIRAAVRNLGGDVRIESYRGSGTTLHVSVPNRRTPVELRVFRAPGAPIVFAVDVAWLDHVADETPAAADPLALLDLPRPSTPPASAAPLLLRRADRCCALFAAGAPRPASALRVCRTPEDSAVEIVQLAEGEALLLRPGVLAGLSLVGVGRG
jgi:two-component system chemotaxis sensor kinase CheA